MAAYAAGKGGLARRDKCPGLKFEYRPYILPRLCRDKARTVTRTNLQKLLPKQLLWEVWWEEKWHWDKFPVSIWVFFYQYDTTNLPQTFIHIPSTVGNFSSWQRLALWKRLSLEEAMALSLGRLQKEQWWPFKPTLKRNVCNYIFMHTHASTTRTVTNIPPFNMFWTSPLADSEESELAALYIINVQY